MSRTRSALRNRSEWLLLQVLLSLVRVLPARVSLAVLRGVGVLAWALLGERRRAAARSVERALGLPAADRRTRRIVRGAFVTMCLQIAEPTLLDRAYRRGRGDRAVTIEGAENMQRCLDSGRGVLLATAHFGAWESIAVVMRERFTKLWAVMRPSENPLVARWMERWRTQVLAGTLDKDGSALKMARLMRDGGIVGLLLDQNAGREGVLLDFLGRPSLHHKVSGLMARRFGAAVVPTYMRREQGHLRYTLVFEAPIEADPSLGADEAIETDVVRRLSLSLAARVRASPEQWLWLHDRWRRAERLIAERAAAASDGEGDARVAGSASAPTGDRPTSDTTHARSGAVAEGTNGA